MVHLCCLLAVATISLASASIPNADYTFDQFVVDYPRDYAPGSDEYSKRKAIFEARLNDILVHNADPSMTWKRGINRFADFTDKEFALSGRFGYNKPLARQYASSNTKTLATLPKQSNASLPASFDWREKGVVSNVKDQGHCGSCWAFATTETVESHAALATGMLPVLSPQQLVSCAPNPMSCGGTGGCQGSVPEVAFNYIQLYGFTTEWMFPYTSYFGSKADNQCDWNSSKAKPVVTISGYQKLPSNDNDAVMAALVNVGPLAVNVDASAWSDYESGVFNGCNGDKVDIDHVVQLVGYGEDSESGQYWLIRNSWDVTWGESGYIRLKRQPSKCATDTTAADGTGCSGGPAEQIVCDTCGILFDVSYPLGVQIPKRGHHTVIV